MVNGNRFWLAAATAAVLLIAAWSVATGRVPVATPPVEVLALLPFGIVGLGAALALRFRRTKLVFTFLLLGLGHWRLSLFADGVGKDVAGQLVYPALCLFWPIVLTTLAFFRDRGVFTRGGLRWLVAIAVPVGAVAMLAGWAAWPGAEVLAPVQKTAIQILHWRPLPRAFDLWTWLPQPAIIAFAVCGALLLVRAVRLRTTDEMAHLGALVAMALALHFVDRPAAPTWFLAAGAAAAFLALVQQAYGLAFLDELTGLPGRRALMTDIARLGPRYAVAMVDIDHFKRFNDKHGHDVGDEVLRLVGVELSRVAGGGRAYRYGGEEFTILFPGSSAADAEPCLEQVRRAIAENDFRLRARQRVRGNPNPRPRRRRGSGSGARKLRVTVSIGIAQSAPERTVPGDVIKAADKALYRAKGVGRNKVVR